ncbi:ATP/GTP-binding protein [Streptomyces pseudogriseolus]|uniref:ATP/GTP-binding protein n=1 Tax=Streptomyces pseudogriseolus TaxID=36817 RepID=UPI003FA1DA32
MLTRRIAAVATCLVTALSLPAVAVADEGPKGSGNAECGMYTCQVEVEVPGQAGGQGGGGSGPGGGGGGGSAGGGAGGGEDTDLTNCTYELADPQPPAGSLEWEGHEPGDGAVYEETCRWNNSGDTIVRMVWFAEPPGDEAAVDPAVLAQQAVDKMTLLGPDIASPRAAGKYVVGVPMWLWVNQSVTAYGPNTASASAGGVTVTATAKVSKIDWKMGDGSTVTCTGPGTPYNGSAGMAESPTCGHVYSKTSASAPGGKYAVTAISTWTIDWQGGGAAGQLTEIRQSDVQVAIGEVQVVR